MCKHYGALLSENHRHYVESEKHDNCVLCLSEAEGPMSLQSVANLLGMTKEEVYKLQKSALKKMKAALGVKRADLSQLPAFSALPKSVTFYNNEMYNISQEVPVFWR